MQDIWRRMSLHRHARSRPVFRRPTIAEQSRVLLAESQEIVRFGFRAMVAEAPDLLIVGEVTAAEAVAPAHRRTRKSPPS